MKPYLAIINPAAGGGRCGKLAAGTVERLRSHPPGRSVRQPQWCAAQAVLGFTEDVPGMLSLGDFFIGKPGPGALSEAVQMGLPVITWRNAWTMPQERYNAQWVQEQGVGLVIRSLDEIAAAAAQVIGRLQELHAATARTSRPASWSATR